MQSTLTVLTQILSPEKDVVKQEVLKPPQSKDYIDVTPGTQCVRIYVAPPDAI